MIRKWLQKLARVLFTDKIELNLIYFLLFFLLVLSMMAAHFYIWEASLFGLPLFFFIQGFGQVLLEAGVFFLVGLSLRRWAPRWLLYPFIGLSFLVLLLHFVDFTIVRLMDASISYMFTYLFGSGVMNLATAFQAMNLSTPFFLLVLVCILALPFIGIGLYRLTQPLSSKLTLHVPLSHVVATLSATCAVLLGLDLVFHPAIPPLVYSKFRKTLPLGTTFIQPQRHCLQVDGSLARARDEAKTEKALRDVRLSVKNKPNIYLFIIETFRADFITEEIAPNLTQFAQENIRCPQSFANANGTHPSWFSIFHSDFPYHWTAMQNSWERGSVPLRLLKQLGYKTHVYSSADLRLFDMDRLLFGNHRELIDVMHDFPNERAWEPCDRDALCLTQFFSDFKQEQNRHGNLFVFFLDSTHSEYSVPKDYPLKFTPVVETIDYLTLTPKGMEPVKNRYRNAVHYVDSLLGRFFQHLKEQGMYNGAIMAITGDHGEEFFEDGALFHGTHLNRYQTAVPLYYKFQSNEWTPSADVTTHLDIFPSVLHYLTGDCNFSSLFDGESIFDANRWPFRIAVLQNGPETPKEFTIQGDRLSLHLRFLDPTNIYETAVLETLDSVVDDDAVVMQALGPLLENL